MSAQKGLILGILLTLSLPVLPQTSKPKNMVMADFNKFHFGYSVGINTVGFTIIPKDGYHLDLVQNPGININLITDYRLGKFLNIRFLPGIQFAQRDITVTNKLTSETGTWPIESVFVDLPVLLKYRSQRVNNYAPYLIAGIGPRFDLTRAEIVGWKPATPMLKSFDFYTELGVGVDFYLSMAKVAVELKFAIGMLDIFLDPEKSEFSLYVSGVDKIFSRMVVLAFHVEQSR
ncbi:MAG: porin family protein [Bacteroidales bacterium]